MAVTETPPETVQAASETAPTAQRPEPRGLAAVLGSGDHKVIGRLYVVASLVMGILVLGLGEAFGIESLQPSTLDVFTSDTAYQLFTLARVATIFLFAFPLVIGVAMVVVPLQVGSRSIAFPRAAAASFWGWLLGSFLLIAAYAMNGGPSGGSQDGVRLWIAAMGLIVLSLLLAAVCLATTVVALRTMGLSLSRLPFFAWAVCVAAIMWLLSLPVLFGTIVLMYVDQRHAGGLAIGNQASLYSSFAWVMRNPQIYVVAIPTLGFVVDVLATTSGARMKLRPVALGAIAGFATFSFGAFLVVPSTVALDSPFVAIVSVLALLPLLALVVSVADVFRRGSFKLNASVLYAISALLILLLGVAAGALGAIPNVLDAPEGATVGANIFFVGVEHAVVIAALIGSLGALTWWATKFGRQPANDKLGMLAPLVLLIGAAAVAIPDMVSGLAGEGAELNGDYTGGIEALNIVVVIGLALVVLGVVISIVSLLPLFKAAEDVPADPWNGQTLEWLTASPPSIGNFDSELAVVTSAEPLIDLREEK